MAVCYSSLLDADIDKILNFASVIFSKDEPLEANDPTNTFEGTQAFFRVLKGSLLLQACTVAKINDEIVGCSLMIDETANIDFTNTFSPQILEIWGAVRHDFHEKYQPFVPGEWAHSLAWVVAPSMRNHGIATEMCTRSECVLKEMGFKHVVVECSSAYSYAASVKLGYQEVTKLLYAMFEFQDGQKKCSNILMPHEAIVLLIKDL